MSKLRVRFAPSPTGPLHIGGARSALFNYLLARHHGGQLVVRIEDTDLERSDVRWENEILQALQWLGITWDEGMIVGGPQASYRQSERLAIYQAIGNQLLAANQAYYCFCTEAELEEERQKLLERGEQVIYSGRCRGLNPEQQAVLRAGGKQAVVRFKVPGQQLLVIDDLVRGRVEFESAGVGDFIILKSDGMPTYNFAVVVDDIEMQITHIVRGEEHLSNTPRQLLLYQAVGQCPPAFAHISLILGEDRSKMSKRHGATSVLQYREWGYLPQALVNYLALLGWSPPGEDEILTLDSLIQLFSLERVAKSPAVFDQEKLKWLNGCYIRQTCPSELLQLGLPYLQRAGMVAAGEMPEDQRQWLAAGVKLVQAYLNTLNELPERMRLVLEAEVKVETAEALQVLAGAEAQAVLRAACDHWAETKLESPDQAQQMLKQLGKSLGISGKKLFQPLRVALTGQIHGPELRDLMPVLGRQKLQLRLQRALDLATSLEQDITSQLDAHRV